MDHLIVFFAIAACLAAILAQISVWSPRKLWIKLSALVTMALFLPTAYISMVDLLSRPKPIEIEWVKLDLAEAAVLSHRMVEDVAIYLWLGIEGADEPRSYVLPWDQETAEQLQQAQRAAEAEGTGVRMKQPFEQSWDKRDKRFNAAPQAPRPLKDQAPHDPMIFQKSRATQKAIAG